LNSLGGLEDGHAQSAETVVYKVRTTVSAEMQDFWQMGPVSMADLATAAQ
jgi:hypothetical protein